MKIAIICAIVLLFGAGVFGIYHLIQRKKEIGGMLSKLPSFSCLKADGAAFSFPDGSIASKRYTMICYVSVDCDHCTRMIDILRAEKDRLGKVNILFITKAGTSELKKFAEAHLLNGWNGVTLLNDQERQVLTLLHVERFPAVYLYDNQDGNLIARLQGGFSIERLFKKLH